MNKNSIKKTCLFYFTASAVIPLLILFSLELTLKISGYGYNPDFFKRISTPDGDFYIDNQYFSRTWFSPRLSRPQIPFRIPADKPPSQFRIFILGASAARGVPEPIFSFSRILEKQLENSFPAIDFLIINTAMTAVNSHVIRDVASECLKLKPDMFVVYLGNNEIVGPFGPGTVFVPFMPSRFLIRNAVYLRKTRTGQLIRNLFKNFQRQNNKNETWGGMSMFIDNCVSADDARLQKAYSNFEKNINDICGYSLRKNIPVILSTVPVNIRDCPPFASMHSRILKQSDIYEFESLFQRATRFQKKGIYDSAAVLYKKALEKDSLHALTHFMLAECLEKNGRHETAQKHFVSARDNDALRFRADTKINRIIKTSAENDNNIIPADTRECFRQNSPDGIPGKNLFHEHVHLTFTGNYILAKNIYMKISPLINEKFNNENFTPVCLSINSCRKHLAYTEWNRAKVLENIKRLISEPPFTNQYKISDRTTELKNEIIKIGTSSGKSGFSEIDTDFTFALSSYPYDAFINFNYGTYCETVLHNHKKSFIYLKRALDIMPNYYNARINLAKVLSREKDAGAALKELEKVLEHIPGHSGALNQTAVEYAAMKNYKKAEKFLEKALYYSEKPTETYVNMAAVYEMRGLLDKSLKYLGKALDYQPNSIYINETMAHILNKKKNHQEAVKHFRWALANNPSRPETHYNLAHTLLIINRIDKAESHLKTAVNLDSEFLPAYILLVSIHEMRGNPQKAEKYYSRIIELNPQLPQSYFGKGIIALTEKDTIKAIEHMKNTLQLNPGYQPARSLLFQLEH